MSSFIHTQITGAAVFLILAAFWLLSLVGSLAKFNGKNTAIAWRTISAVFGVVGVLLLTTPL